MYPHDTFLLGYPFLLGAHKNAVTDRQLSPQCVVPFAQGAFAHVQAKSNVRVRVAFARGDVRHAVAFMGRMLEQKQFLLVPCAKRLLVLRLRVMRDNSYRSCAMNNRGFRLSNFAFERLRRGLSIICFCRLCRGLLSFQIVELVILDQLDQFRGVVLVRSIAAGFEAVCPAFVVLYRYLEAGSVPRTLQEQRVVFETLRRVAVLTKTLAFAVVVMVIHPSEPFVGAFDAEMVIGVHRQFATARRGLQQGLRHDDRSRNAVLRLVLERSSFPLLDIRQIIRVQFLCRHAQREQECSQNKCCFLHRFYL